MAPALNVTPQVAHYDVVDDTEKHTHRRRALASVDNIETHMEEDDMGLQTQPSLAKDSQEMDQILVDLNSDLGQADLLQAIKTLESGGDSLSTGDADVMFPLSGFDLAETVDSEGDASEDKIRLLQSRLERRCAFLLRRLRILQARSLGKRISEEAGQTFEKSTRGARKDGGGRPMGIKALLKRIETTAALQASAASRSVVGPKYYRAGTSKGDATRSASIGIASGTLTGLEDSAGALRSHLSVVKNQLDSDATASSSGAESNDEAVTYNNPHQEQMPIEKRALWSWQKERAGIASRWCWLQVQVQELEYKIRQHSDLHKQVREAKGAVEFEGSPEGYSGSLPGGAAGCARTRPLRREVFRKRKLLQMHNLHTAITKASKPADIKCSCMVGQESCAVCTGRADATQPAPPTCTLAPAQRLALVEPAHHPVLSHPADISPSLHLSALTSRSWFRSRCKAWRGGHTPHAAPPAPPRAAPAHPLAPRAYRRHPTRLKRGRPPLSRKVQEREREEETSTSGQERWRARASTESRAWRRASYDIDNIVIPASVAASTRPEILTYKEIVTPKWRVMDMPEAPVNNGVTRTNVRTKRIIVYSDDDEDEEDISEAAVQARHTRAETRERNRYLRKRRSRRNNNVDADHCDAPAPPPHAPPAPPPHAPPAPAHSRPASPPDSHETVKPYSPRQFPLPESTYHDMLSSMPQCYRPSSPEPSPPRPGRSPPRPGRSPPRPGRSPPRAEELDDCSTLSPLSPLLFDGDDPDDAEWNPGIEKVERRKSAFR